MQTQMAERQNRGVYFLANDKVFDLTMAFLNSFRKYNPDISLCLIPYNSDAAKIIALKEKYKFEIFRNNELLEECDNISEAFHGNINGSYRKLVMWEGIYENFIYIDIDTVVLENVSFAFTFLEDYDILTSHSNIPALQKFVWKKSVVNSRLLTRSQVQYSANTGFIVSKHGAIPFSEIRTTKLENGLELKPHMVLMCQEQPFLNYCIVTSNKHYSSLMVLGNSIPGIMTEKWGGHPGGNVTNGKIWFPQDHRDVFLVHWAGVWRPQKIDLIIYNMLRVFGYSRPTINTRMPYKKLWLYYRHYDERSQGTLTEN